MDVTGGTMRGDEAGPIGDWRSERLSGSGDARRIVAFEGRDVVVSFLGGPCECLEVEGEHVYLWHLDPRIGGGATWRCADAAPAEAADATPSRANGGTAPVEAELAYRNWRGEVADRRIRVVGLRWAAQPPYHPEAGLLIDAVDLESGKARSFAASGFAARGTVPPTPDVLRRYLAAALAERLASHGPAEDPADPHWSVGAARILAEVDPGDATGPDPVTGEDVAWPSRALAEVADLGPPPREGTAMLRPYAAFRGVRATNAFDLVQALTWERCDTAMPIPLDGWNPMEWACAMAGEAGEFCNKAKKASRDAASLDDAMLELADTVIYAHLAASRLRRRLWPVVAWKVNTVSALRGSPLRIALLPDGATRR